MYDLIVVGAGVLGAFHAYHAAKIGKKVLLLEKDERQAGSSVQNFGQVVPSGLSTTWNAYGQQSLRTYRELMKLGDFTLKQGGSVYVASDEDELLLLEELSDKHQAIGYECIPLTRKGVLERYPAIRETYVKGGLFYPQEMSVNPREFVNRFTDYLQSSGMVDVRYQEKVIETLETGGLCQVSTESGQKFQAEKVLICCGYTFHVLYPDIFKESRITLSKLQMMKTKPIAGVNLHSNILTGLTIRRYESFSECPSYSSIRTPERLIPFKEMGIHILFKQEADGSVIIGDSHEYGAYDELEALGEHSREDIDQLILDETRRIVHFEPGEMAHIWAGFYGQHPDDLFTFEPSAHIRIITGIGGKGMTSSAGYAAHSIRQLYQL